MTSIRDWKLDVMGLGEISLMQLVLAAAAGVLIVVIIRQLTKKRYNLPPGPRPWPIVGNLLTLRGGTTPTYERFVEMSKEYGDVFLFHFGPRPAVILNSWDAIREAFHDKATSFSDRPVNATLTSVSLDNHALISAQYGPICRIQRKIAHTAMRRFAKGGDVEKLVRSRVATVVQQMLDKKGEPFDPKEYTTFLVYNIMASMIFAQSFEMDDPFFVEISRKTDELRNLIAAGNMADLYPILGYLPNRALQIINKLLDRFMCYLDDRLKEHRAAFNPDDLRDFMDLILDAGKQAQEDTSDDVMALQLLDHMHLVALLKDAFFGGTDTTRMIIQWAIALCVQYPETQERIHQEIDAVVGKDDEITVAILPKLRYLEAFTREVMRFRPIAPLALPHATSQDTTLSNFTIPKGTIIAANIWALHMDSKLWDAPKTFNPERWLNDQGHILPKPDHFIPFSTGQRSCPGKAVAEVEIPFLIASFLQRLTFKPTTAAPFKAKPTNDSFLCQVADFEIIASAR